MKDLSFVEGEIPKGFKVDFEPYLFNSELHRDAQADQGWHSYFLTRKDNRKVLAAVHFHFEGWVASSPCRAPFGSVEFTPKIQPKDLYEFLREVESGIKGHGLRKILIKNPPEAYQPVKSSLLEVMLLNLGYHIHQAEISTTIKVDKTGYDQKVEAWELRKLKQGKKAKLTFQEIPLSLMDEVYDFIQASRQERGQQLSMTSAEVMKMAAACPEDLVLFGIYRRKELAAASIAIRINKRILYNFYSAHPRSMDYLSPVVSLIQGMYKWCQKQHIELLDLGTSALEGKPNFNLLDFKLRLGGVPSAKFTFEKDIA